MIATTLTIAGSDSSGGAGIQADLKAIAANGGYGASVISALTAQNTRGVTLAEPVSLEMLEAQLEAVFTDLNVVAVKTGMLPTPDCIRTVAAALRRFQPRHVVVDPVMISKTGFELIPAESVSALREHLLPLATLVTPNSQEAAALTGTGAVTTLAQADAAGRRLLADGCPAVLVKAGHLEEDDATDVLVLANDQALFPAPRLVQRHTHGTGCSYAAAIATWLGHGLELTAAIEAAKQFLTLAIADGLEVGAGVGPTQPFHFMADPSRAASWVEQLQRWQAEAQR